MKVSARLPDARAFISAYSVDQTMAENAARAYRERWYGNASERVGRELTRFFTGRFCFFPGHLTFLRRFLESGEGESFPVLNHFYMVLSDPYYRWAAAEYLPARIESGLPEIPRTGFENEARVVLPAALGAKSANRYCRNILTALRDNGYLVGQVNKEIVSPAIRAKALGFMLYSLGEFGEGFNEFDGSPVLRSLLKPRELLVPLFREGERSFWWEFTGDRDRITGNLKLKGLSAFLSEVGA